MIKVICLIPRDVDIKNELQRKNCMLHVQEGGGGGGVSRKSSRINILNFKNFDFFLEKSAIFNEVFYISTEFIIGQREAAEH